MILCYVTDSHALEPQPLLPLLAQAIQGGVDLIQIREKALAAPSLVELAESAVEAARGTGTRIIVNDRLDVALACGAGGVHLGTQSLPTHAVRGAVPREFLVGVSCHSPDEARRAESEGADYIVLGPIFETRSKLPYGPPLGLQKLREVTSRARIPVLGIGGVTVERVPLCLEAGASGIAAISLFQLSSSLAETVQALRRKNAPPRAGVR